MLRSRSGKPRRCPAACDAAPPAEVLAGRGTLSRRGPLQTACRSVRSSRRTARPPARGDTAISDNMRLDNNWERVEKEVSRRADGSAGKAHTLPGFPPLPAGFPMTMDSFIVLVQDMDGKRDAAKENRKKREEENRKKREEEEREEEKRKKKDEEDCKKAEEEEEASQEGGRRGGGSASQEEGRDQHGRQPTAANASNSGAKPRRRRPGIRART